MFEIIKKAILVSRPIFIPIAPAAYLFGLSAGGSSIDLIAAAEILLLTIPLGIYVFGLNDLFDIESDRANPRRKGSLWGAKIQDNDKEWIFRASALVIAAIFFTAILSMEPVHILVTALFLPFPFIYSVPPVRLKSKPVLDSLTNATYTYAPFAMGFSLSGNLGFLDMQMILFALVFSAAHAIGTIMDLEGDRKAGIRTFASVLGPRKAAAFAVFLLALNLPFAYNSMKSIFIVILIYFIASMAVLAWPSEKNAKWCFVAMVASLMAWMAYAALAVVFKTLEMI